MSLSLIFYIYIYIYNIFLLPFCFVFLPDFFYYLLFIHLFLYLGYPGDSGAKFYIEEISFYGVAHPVKKVSVNGQSTPFTFDTSSYVLVVSGIQLNVVSNWSVMWS